MSDGHPADEIARCEACGEETSRYVRLSRWGWATPDVEAWYDHSVDEDGGRWDIDWEHQHVRSLNGKILCLRGCLYSYIEAEIIEQEHAAPREGDDGA
jgi:hypothetical protein